VIDSNHKEALKFWCYYDA